MKNTKTLTRVALLVAIELVMKMVGLGSVPVGPLYMSFLTLPIAVGAITMGPAVGALLGGVFGAVSFYDAITGASAMTGALFQVSPVNTFILCVGMRVLMGLCCGLIFSSLKRFDKPGTWSYIVSAMSAPFLNTVFFMGWIVLAFYGCDYVQNLVSVKGAANPFMFVVLLVYIALIQPVGFLISTFLFLFAEFNILTYKEDRKLGFSVVFALVCAVGIYAMFKYGFKMPLPQGILKGIF